MSLRHARAVCCCGILALLLVLGRSPEVLPAHAADLGPGEGVAAPTTIDLATFPATRWVVQLADAPLAAYTGGRAGLAPTAIDVTGARRLDVGARASRAYRRHLLDAQNAFRAQLAKAAPGAVVQQSYQIVVNGLGVKMTASQAAAVRVLPGVKAVTPDVPFKLDMFSTPNQIGAPAIWALLGGKATAGNGVKVGIIDGGIFVKYDVAGNYAGNACFKDDNFTTPAGFPKGDVRFTNKKVIVAKAYFRPDDPPVAGSETPLPGPNGGDTAHGTHVSGTVACDADTPATYQNIPVLLDGVAPGAYLMNYKVFYASHSIEGFQNGNAYVVELVKAIEDSIEDGADVISNSWGASYQNTLAWPDPMVQAAELAMRSGVVAVFANGNAGPDTASVNSPAIAPSVISVGAVTRDATVSVGDLSVTGPAPVPAPIQTMDVGGSQVGPQDVQHFGPTAYVAADTVTTNGSDLACSLPNDVNPFPAGSLTGRVALVQRGVCVQTQKVYNAQLAGAVAVLMYNNAANGDAIQELAGDDPHNGSITIPNWFMRNSDGIAMRQFVTNHPGATVQFTLRAHVAPTPGDVMAGFSSRGPSSDKYLKPDVVAPGVNILSSGFAPRGDNPDATYVGFGAVSGTSMATPHVAGAAALLVALHPDWKPWQVKAALMGTASEQVYVDQLKTVMAGLLDRGAGRIDLNFAGHPGVFADPPSVSGGEVWPGKQMDVAMKVYEAEGKAGTWRVDVEPHGSVTDTRHVAITTSLTAPLSVPAGGSAGFTLGIQVAADARLGDFEATVWLRNDATGQKVHVPLWLRVVPPPTTDVLLLDDDGSANDTSVMDYSAVYSNTLKALGVSFHYVDLAADDLPSLLDLYHYRGALLFTGDNMEGSNIGGSAENRFEEWLDGGGRVLATGQHLAETQGSSEHNHKLDGSRLYHGYLGLTFVLSDTFHAAAPKPSLAGSGPFAGLTVDLSPGGDGAGNQRSVAAMRPITDTDTYAGTPYTLPAFRPLTASLPDYAANGYTRAWFPTLEDGHPGIRYRALSLGFGLEGVNSDTGSVSRADLLHRALDWLLSDAGSATMADILPTAGVDFQVSATYHHERGATATTLRWDFGDGTPVLTTDATKDGLLAHHVFKTPGTYAMRVEITNSLGQRVIAGGTAVVGPGAGTGGLTLYLPILVLGQPWPGHD